MVERYSQSAAQRYSIAPGQLATVNDGALARWGLLAPWRGHGGVRPPPIYTARRVEIAATPVLRRGAPCRILADGFYAKARLGAKVHAWWIHGATAFAGILATHRDDGIAAFCILTAPAPAELARYTTEVPIAVDAAGVLLDLAWRAVEITRRFETHDDAACIAALGNPAQGSLF